MISLSNSSTAANSLMSTTVASVSDQSTSNISSTDTDGVIDRRSMLERVAWSTLLFMIIMASLIGNMLVIVCVRLHHRLREEKSNIFIVNLSVTDMSSAVIVMLSSFQALAVDQWRLGPIWCDIVCGMNYTLIIVSMLTLCFISLDRYIAVIHALHYHTRVTRFRIYVLVAYAWFQGVCFGLAPILARWIKYDYWEIVCAIQWHKDNSNTLIYVIVAFAVCFLFPGVVLVVAYCKVMKVASAHNNVHPQQTGFRPNQPVHDDFLTSDYVQTSSRSTHSNNECGRRAEDKEDEREDMTTEEMGGTEGRQDGSNNGTDHTEENMETVLPDASPPPHHPKIQRQTTNDALLSNGVNRASNHHDFREVKNDHDMVEVVKAGYPQNNKAENGTTRWLGMAALMASKRNKAKGGIVLKLTNMNTDVVQETWAERVGAASSTESNDPHAEGTKTLDHTDKALSTDNIAAGTDVQNLNSEAGAAPSSLPESGPASVNNENTNASNTQKSSPSSSIVLDFASPSTDQKVWARKNRLVSQDTNDTQVDDATDQGSSTNWETSEIPGDIDDSDSGNAVNAPARPGDYLNVAGTDDNAGRSHQNNTTNSIPRHVSQARTRAVSKKNYSASSKAVKSLLIVVLAYFVCMTPFSITKLYKVVFPDKNALPGYMNLVASIFQYCSSAINPLIYGIFRKDFQRAFVIMAKKMLVKFRIRDASNVDFYTTSY